MNQYEKVKELENKLMSGEELDDLDYLRIINVRKNIMQENFNVITTSDYSKTLAKLKLLSFIGKLGGKKTKYLPQVANYYGSTLDTLKDNYNEVLTGAEIVGFNRSKTNMITFIEQVKELENYDNLIDNFEREFTKKLNKGFKTFHAPVCMEEMFELDDSSSKIKTLSNKYRR